MKGWNMKLLKYFKKRSKAKKEIVSAGDYFHWNDPLYVETIKKNWPDRYQNVLEALKRQKPECCISCFAFYWLKDIEGCITEPACTMGGVFEGTDEYEVCKNCPLKGEQE